MAEIPSVYKFVILFTLIAFHAFIWAEGRQIKSMNKKEASAVKKESQGKTAEGRSINLHQSVAQRKEDFHPSQPSRDHITSAEHNIARKKEIFPTISFGDAAAVYKDDFRPTTPGNSPGVGHKHGKVEEDDFRPTTPGNSPGFGHKHGKVEEDDFLPTTPGNSPGVGHKHAEEEEDHESKVQGHRSLSKTEYSLTGFQNDFRPRAPGHSPGPDFRPTAPGRSPGTGRSLSNEKAEPKA